MRVLKIYIFFAQNSPTWLGEYATGFKIDDLFYNLSNFQKLGKIDFWDRFNQSSINRKKNRDHYVPLISEFNMMFT